MPPIENWSAVELAVQVAASEVSATELVDAHIDRVESTHSRINAVVQPRFEQARAEAAQADEAVAQGRPLGPLHGVPITVKDQYDVAGMPTTYGVARLLGNVARGDDPMVAALKQAGAIVIGKTNVPQTLGTIETDNAVYGRTNNPWNTSRTSGGSSGGEAAAIAAGASVLGLGGDFGGSIRIPAAWCGIFGLKPTARRLMPGPPPVGTAEGVEGIVAQPGPMARHARDVAAAFRVLVEAPSGHSTLNPPVPWRDVPQPEGLRVGLLTDVGGWPLAPAVSRGLHQAGEALRSQGVQVLDWTHAPDTQEIINQFFAIVGATDFAFVRDILGEEDPLPLMEPTTRLTSMPAPMMTVLAQVLRLSGQRRLQNMALCTKTARSADELLRVLHHRLELEISFRMAMVAADLDAILCPVAPIVAPVHGTTLDMADFWGPSLLFNVLGWPAGVAPVTAAAHSEQSVAAKSRDKAVRAVLGSARGSAGLPVSVQIAAPPWREDIVLSLMTAVEDACSTEADYPGLASLSDAGTP